MAKVCVSPTPPPLFLEVWGEELAKPATFLGVIIDACILKEGTHSLEKQLEPWITKVNESCEQFTS